MTSLTDKMEGLRRDTTNEFDIGSERSTPKIIRDNGFNQGVEASIALAQAEAAVVGDLAEFEDWLIGEDGWLIDHPEEHCNDIIEYVITLLAAQRAKVCKDFTYSLGQKLRKKSGSEWSGTVVGFYSTELTPEGYAIESDKHKGTVQIYPLAALELIVCEPS